MKKTQARWIACLLVCAIGVTCSACGRSQGDNSDSTGGGDASSSMDSSELEQMQKQDMEFNYALEDEDSANSAEVPVNQGVNQSSGTDSNEDSYVVVTDESGQPTTDSSGAIVTELVKNNSSSSTTSSESSSNGNSASDNSSSDTYTASSKTFQAYWLDMSQGKDYVFNGDFIDVTFKIKDSAPDGNYALTSGACDFANWNAESVSASFVNGCITVGDVTPTAVESAQDGTFTIAAGTAQGTQGDEVTVRFDMSDNPGIVALIFRFQYDSNALEIVDAVVGDDCSDYITLSQS